MRKKFKKALTLVLTLVMVLSLFSGTGITAYADVVAPVVYNLGSPTDVAEAGSDLIYKLGGATVTGNGGYTFTVSVDTGSFRIGSTTLGSSAVTAQKEDGEFVTSMSSEVDYTYLELNFGSTPFSLEEVQAFLRDISFTKEKNVDQKISISSENFALPDPLERKIITFQGHYYEFVFPYGHTWKEAYDLAKTKTINGYKGYLLTITSPQEHELIYKAFGGEAGWFGMSGVLPVDDTYDENTFVLDEVYENNTVWHWMCGPEAGQIVRGEGAYVNFGSGEPTGTGTNPSKLVDYLKYSFNECVGVYGWGEGGAWNDLPWVHENTEGGWPGAYIEYGGYEGETADTPSTIVTKTVTLDDYVAVDSNSAPTFSDSSVSLGSINEDSLPDTGITVSDLLVAAGASDADGDTLGIAVTAIDTTNGVWLYYAADGFWWRMPRFAPEDISENAALLLTPSTPIKFFPTKDFNGTATISFRVWDRTTGITGENEERADVSGSNHGGTTAYSDGTVVGTLTVLPVNDAPVILREAGNHMQLEFDGSDDYLSLDDLHLDHSFTVEAWVRIDDFANHHPSRFFDFGKGPNGFNQCVIFLGSGLMQFHIYGNNGAVGLNHANPGISIGTWNYISAVYDENAKKLRLYKNGELIVEEDAVVQKEAQERTKNFFGRSNWVADPYFDGAMYGISVWSAARTASEMKRDMYNAPAASASNLVLYYPLDDGAEATTVRSITGTHTGTLNNGLKLEPGDIFNYGVTGTWAQDIAVNQITLKDVDAGENDMTLTLAALHGTLTFSTVSDGVVAIGNGTDSVTLTGTLSKLNAALVTLKYKSGAEYTGETDEISVSVTDEGTLTDSETVFVTLEEVVGIYPVTVNTLIDGDAAEAPGTVELKQGGVTKATAINAETIGTYTASLPDGTYDIWIGGKNTGKTVTVSGGAVTADAVNYYTVSFSVTNSGLASGSTVSAIIGDTPIADGSPILAGTTVQVTAAGAGANSYTYLWSGNGTSGQTAAALSITISGAVNAVCTITGSNSYSVALNTNGGTINSGNIVSYDYGTAMTLPTDITKTNATFAGWYTDADFSETPVTQISGSDTGNKTYYAKWTNTVIFSNNYSGGGNFATRTNAIHGSIMTSAGTPTRDGYMFAGWYKDAIGLDPWSFTDDKVTSNITLYARWITSAYTITGTVVDDTSGPANVSGATIKLMQGNTQFGETVTTDANGNFELTGVPNGIYNLVASKDGKTVTVCVTVKNGSYDFGTDYIVLPTGNKSSILDVKGNDTPSVVVDGLNSQFTSADAIAVSNGDIVKITLEVENKGTSAPGASDLQTAAAGKTIDMYLDMTVFHQVNSDAPTTLSTVPSLLKIIVPYDLSGKSNVTVYRYHGASAQPMAQLAYSATAPVGEGYMLNTTDNQIIIWAQNFSTYAIAYSIGSTPGSPSGGTSGSVASYSITVSAKGTGGSISPSGNVSVANGGSKTFTITPDKGYVIADVLVDGKSVGAVSSYTFSSITAAHTLSVVFAKAAGLPYYYDGSGKKVFIGFASDHSGTMQYIAPAEKTVLFQENPKSFIDISGHWGKSYIDFVTEREIFVGTEDKIFSPDTGMTRAMLATVIGRLYERSYGELKTTGAHAFTDCNYDSWYGSYIDWCSEKGIIQGVGSSRFEPNREVTRQEMAAMLYRFAQILKTSKDIPAGSELSYSDKAEIASWAQDAALYCQETLIITGRNGGNFAPKEIATRSEVAAILKRFIEMLV